MEWAKDKKDSTPRTRRQSSEGNTYQALPTTEGDSEEHRQINGEGIGPSNKATKRKGRKEIHSTEDVPLVEEKSNKFGFLGKDPDKESIVHDLDKKAKWRHDLGEFLEGHRMQSIMALLLFMDVFCVVVELLISSNIIRNDTEGAKHTTEILHICSLSILSFFGLEVCLLIVSFGPSFFRHPWYVLDFVVIFASIIVDALLHSDEAELLLIFRLWRVVRILHGLYTIREIDHKEKLDLRKQVEQLEEELEEKRSYIQTLENKLGIPSR